MSELVDKNGECNDPMVVIAAKQISAITDQLMHNLIRPGVPLSHIHTVEHMLKAQVGTAVNMAVLKERARRSEEEG